MSTTIVKTIELANYSAENLTSLYFQGWNLILYGQQLDIDFKGDFSLKGKSYNSKTIFKLNRANPNLLFDCVQYPDTKTIEIFALDS